MDCRLNFSLDNDNRPYIEPISADLMKDQKRAPLFINQYRYALGQIDHYLSALEHDNDVRFCVDNTNNIFAFLGERGSGKTSCMMSLAKHLIDKKQRSTWDEEYPYVSRQNFEFVQIVDPSFFDEQHNLLALFIAQLYHAFSEIDKRGDDRQKERIKTELIRKFCSAQKHMQQILDKGMQKSDDQLEQLSSLSAATQLREDIHQLVETYLEYVDKKDSQLLVCIDDIDLNASQASQMAEEVRKYFVHPNMIVFLSLKLDQLECIKRKDFMMLFGEHTSQDEIEEMIERYLAKLLPHSQRIYMPDTEVFFGESVCLTAKDLSAKQMKEYEFQTVRQAIPQLIFWKTRYLFYNSEKYTSYIVPRNLRELRQLFKLLGKMPHYRNDDVPSATNLYNKRLFKKYLLENWTINNLTPEYRKLVERVISVDDNLYFNSIVLKVIQEAFNLAPSNAGDNKTEQDRLLDSANSSCNISMGDVIGLITILEKQYVEENHRKFLFFLKTICSIRLYEAYDEVTEPVHNAENKRKEIFFDEQYKAINQYSRLSNGGLMNNSMIGLFSKDGRTTPVSGTISVNALAELMSDCLSDWDKALLDGRVRFTEAIMLCAARPYEQNGEYRTFTHPQYASRMTTGILLFVPETFFFNVTRIRECYARFEKLSWKNDNVGTNFIQKLFADENDANPNTLIGCFRRETLKERQGVREADINKYLHIYNANRWLSLCSFRNAEIIQDFTNFIAQSLDTSPIIDYRLIVEYFNQASKYKVKTYDRDSDGNPYHISYVFASHIADLLTMPVVKKKFGQMYRSLSIEDKRNTIVKVEVKKQRRQNGANTQDNKTSLQSSDSDISL